MMRSILVVAMSAALLAGTAIAPAMAQDSNATPPLDSSQQDSSQQDSSQQDGVPVTQPQANPTMPRPVPRKPASDTTLVVGGLAAIIGVIVAVGSAGGDDSPSSP